MSQPTPTGPDTNTNTKKKMCCACPHTKKLRDDCVLQKGEEQCAAVIEQHLKCLRQEGFNV